MIWGGEKKEAKQTQNRHQNPKNIVYLTYKKTLLMLFRLVTCVMEGLYLENKEIQLIQ